MYVRTTREKRETYMHHPVFAQAHLRHGGLVVLLSRRKDAGSFGSIQQRACEREAREARERQQNHMRCSRTGMTAEHRYSRLLVTLCGFPK